MHYRSRITLVLSLILCVLGLARHCLAQPGLAQQPAIPGKTGSTRNAVAPASASTNVVKAHANSGNINSIGKFVNSTDLVSSSITEINGNVGIFAPNPLISLDVRTGSLPQLGVAGTTDYVTFFASDQFGPAIYWDPAKDLRLGKGGASLYNPFGFVEYFRIQSTTGNVGIGTLTPGSKLDVAGDMNLAGIVRFQGQPLLQVPGGVSANNVSLGLGALSSADGINNTAVGYSALSQNTFGQSNTAVGAQSMFSNLTGGNNTGIGEQALYSNSTGGNNTALGLNALYSNTSGSGNIAIGGNAAQRVSGSNSNNIHIGNLGAAADNGTVRIGDVQTRFFAAGIRGVTTGSSDAIAVMIDSNGQLGTISSSRRFKEDIHDMGDASLGLMRLRPVTFRYKKPFADGSKPIQYGLIAEEVAEVYPDLVAHSSDGQIETVKYQVLDSMLLNEVQREQREIGELQRKLDEQRTQNKLLLERLIKAEAAVSAVTMR